MSRPPEELEQIAVAKVGAIRLALVVVGGACISIGAWLVYPPAGWIVGGALPLLVGLVGAWRDSARAARGVPEGPV